MSDSTSIRGSMLNTFIQMTTDQIRSEQFSKSTEGQVLAASVADRLQSAASSYQDKIDQRRALRDAVHERIAKLGTNDTALKSRLEASVKDYDRDIAVWEHSRNSILAPGLKP
jgi:hypothetical protein